MEELTLSQEDIQELLAILNVALYDAETSKRISRDLEMIDTIEDHRENIRKWITRLIKQIESFHVPEHDPHRDYAAENPDRDQEQQSKPRMDIEVEDAESQAHQDWSNDE
jgi:hypothetical protein